MTTFRLFSKYSGLKPNISKFEVAGIGSLKGVKMAVYGIRNHSEIKGSLFRVRMLPMCRGELPAVTARLMSKCL